MTVDQAVKELGTIVPMTPKQKKATKTILQNLVKETMVQTCTHTVNELRNNVKA